MVYAALGSRVTLVELQDRLLPGVDRDLVESLHAVWRGSSRPSGCGRGDRLQEDETGRSSGGGEGGATWSSASTGRRS